MPVGAYDDDLRDRRVSKGKHGCFVAVAFSCDFCSWSWCTAHIILSCDVILVNDICVNAARRIMRTFVHLL